jgi:transposase
MANVLSTEKRSRIVSALVEGNSIRATARMVGVSKNTVRSLRTDRDNRVTPAMAAGIARRPIKVEELVGLLDSN